MQSISKDHLFFKRQLNDKSTQFLLTIGVDQFIQQQFPNNSQPDDIQQYWQNIEYLIKQIIVTPSQLSNIIGNTQIVQANLSVFIQSLKFYWLINVQQALVQFYQSLQSKLSPFQQELITRISQLNCKWQFEGIHIISLIFDDNISTLVIKLKQNIVEFQYREVSSINADGFLFSIKKYIFRKVLAEIEIYCENEFDIQALLDKLTIEDRIKAVFILNEKYGLTFNIDKQIISSKLLTRSVAYLYRRNITLLVKICSKIFPQIDFTSQLMQLVESGEEDMQVSFQKVYYKVLQLGKQNN